MCQLNCVAKNLSQKKNFEGTYSVAQVDLVCLVGLMCVMLVDNSTATQCAEKGLVYQKIKLQKIKEKYLSFRGGDLTPICLLIYSFNLCVYMSAHLEKIFF